MKEEYLKLLKKKAEGYYISEEVVDYEGERKTKFLFCSKHNRLYFSNGFIHIKPIKEYKESIEFSFNRFKKCVVNTYFINCPLYRRSKGNI